MQLKDLAKPTMEMVTKPTYRATMDLPSLVTAVRDFLDAEASSAFTDEHIEMVLRTSEGNTNLELVVAAVGTLDQVYRVADLAGVDVTNDPRTEKGAAVLDHKVRNSGGLGRFLGRTEPFER